MIYDTIYAALSPLGYEVMASEKQNPKELPDTFIKYEIIDSPSSTFADNKDTGITYRVQISFYTRNNALIQTVPFSIDSAMRNSDFMRLGGRQIPQNKETLHFGWSCDYRYYERI